MLTVLYYVTGFHLDQMPLGSSIGGKSKRLSRVLSTRCSTLLMLFDNVVGNVCLLIIALKDLLETDATDFKKPG